MDLSLLSINDLFLELRKLSQAYVSMYNKYDESIGPNGVSTQVSCYEKYRMQMVGLSTKMVYLFDNFYKSNYMHNFDNKSEKFKICYDLVVELKNRCQSIVIGVISLDANDLYVGYDNSIKQCEMANKLYQAVINNMKTGDRNV
jgi:hypothetical protein